MPDMSPQDSRLPRTKSVNNYLQVFHYLWIFGPDTDITAPHAWQLGRPHQLPPMRATITQEGRLTCRGVNTPVKTCALKNVLLPADGRGRAGGRHVLASSSPPAHAQPHRMQIVRSSRPPPGRRWPHAGQASQGRPLAGRRPSCPCQMPSCRTWHRRPRAVRAEGSCICSCDPSQVRLLSPVWSCPPCA